VTFHFRKLQEGRDASDEAKSKALHYSIDIPKGFTFVDMHIRGGGAEGGSSIPKVSALDFFSKIIEKVAK
jgi:hypothetical protein